MRLTNLALLSTGLVFALFACRGGGGDDTPMPDGPVGGSVKVKDVQAETMPVGTAVELRGVVVTAIDGFGDRTGDLWVQDVEGGAFSGVKVFGAPLDQLAAIAVGDLVDITNGEKDEFALTSDTTGRKVTEVKGAAGGMLTITKKGTGTVPAPQVVDAKMIATMDKATREAEWEKWEGVLIKVTNARQLAAKRTFGSMPGPDSTEFRITGIARVQSVLADLNADEGFGVCYDSITGVGDYFFNDLVLPRSAADIVSGGTGCNPFAQTIVQAQTGTNVEIAQFTNAVVTAIGAGGKGYWVADAAQGAVNNGVFVYTGSDPAPATAVIGSIVNVQGFVDEFDAPSAPTGDKLTELSTETGARGTVVTVAGSAPTPLNATVAQVGTIAGGETYEGVLVKLSGVKVTNLNAGAGKVELSDNANNKVIMDNDTNFNWAAPGANTCYSSLTGVMSVQLIDDVRTINPRSVADMVVDASGTSCN